MSGFELVDVVDEHDVVVGRVSRAEMRRRRLRHRSAYILVFDREGRVFIHRRTATKDVFPSYWDVAVGGVIASGESYDQGARREVLEEIGFSSVELRKLFSLQYEDEHACVNGMVYTCCSDDQPRLQADEIEIGEWVKPVDVPQLARHRRFCPDGLAAFKRYCELAGCR